ncbi:hypothetical protein HYT54_01605 [Candidatus Woesearchaeota archaeon]|nr:hypothetical protein [Candidatus Woesearchaeota archaeon]
MQKEEKKLGKILVMVFMAFTLVGMTFSFVFFGFSSPDQKVKYKDFKFVYNQQSQAWMVKVQDKYAAFSFLPDEVEDMNITADLTMLRQKPEIDSTYDLNDTNADAIALAQHQMGLTFQNYDVFLRAGAMSENRYNLPVINCSIATPNIPVIYFRASNLTMISQQGSCIIIESNRDVNFLMAKDRILYSILGILG